MKYVPWLICVVSLGAAALMGFALLNGGSALTDARSQVGYLEERSELALSFVREQWVGRTRADLLQAAEAARKRGVIVKDHPEVVEVGDISFHVANDRITGVTYF
ncbi:hypothetical protein [Pseudoxanthomonas sp. PXM02]|uniref:hypothetical protein n=1 Tax=Pseudoxanthomonas sp. PXM02 TaxID=2769294 RepID=UPI001785B526|nr:hypothetical protein [Pseudoxanthomonas sp. PXM02]MBD9480098.1 hypothetical protein [Pseudoxanthomonas sp. PXM02]